MCHRKEIELMAMSRGRFGSLVNVKGAGIANYGNDENYAICHAREYGVVTTCTFNPMITEEKFANRVL